ncbi:hypothetical protein AB4306_18260 [Vibrio splendidus]|uniref:hypothetical protein n=1 Tax=Vibrio splendidus TaxID=29497 RepID=UPI00076A42C3|nr:hypothetical protein [Vibrio splendidus]PHX05516.1 hypothetical protein VSPL_29100 [Vibrio splendidus]
MTEIIKDNLLRAIAEKTMSYLLACHIRGGKAKNRGRSFEEVHLYTGQDIIDTAKMLTNLMNHHLVEEFDHSGELHYRPINVPDHINIRSGLNDILSYSESAISNVTFGELMSQGNE